MEALIAAYVERLRLGVDARAVVQLGRFGELLVKWNRITNLIGDDSPATIVAEHIGDCLSVAPYIQAARIADIGSGAGFPGIVLAIVHPDMYVNLVESRRRKTRFLTQAVIELNLPNVAVCASRIEKWSPPESVDAAICRGYSDLEKFCKDTRHLHRRGFKLFAMKGQRPDDELAALPADLWCATVTPLTVPDRRHRHLVTLVRRE